MIVIVDSNIVFSAILNSQNKIGQLIINSSNFFSFYSVSLLKEEIDFHKDKILSITGYTGLNPKSISKIPTFHYK